ncbi:MAG: C-terminal helicase domain-containing protein [Acidimicrobiales bacterium]
MLALVDDLVGRSWTDPHDRSRPGTRPLEPGDVLVVAPFNAQVNRLAERLAAAGYHDGDGGRGAVAVGTVDRFQGREAPVVIVSMTASSADASSRGAGFLLSRHRLNVAISRAQHTAVLVHAPGIGDFVPPTPDGLARLGAFLGVSQAGRGR